MSIARDAFDLRYAGVYLPALLMLILSPDIPFQLFISIGALVAAVLFHGLSRNVFGVGGPEENPVETSKALQRLQATITGKGPVGKFPDSSLGMLALWTSTSTPITRSAVAVAVTGILTIPAWLTALTCTMYVGLLQFTTVRTGTQLLVFAQLVWVLQWGVWRGLDPAYLRTPDDYEGAGSDDDVDSDVEGDEHKGDVYNSEPTDSQARGKQERA